MDTFALTQIKGEGLLAKVIAEDSSFMGLLLSSSIKTVFVNDVYIEIKK